ncbi:MAG: hypothetical protein O3C27_04525 [Actinomycetota bacterium]|nr:hypothetical protein [Actinomycetota bacterium]
MAGIREQGQRIDSEASNQLDDEEHSDDAERQEQRSATTVGRTGQTGAVRMPVCTAVCMPVCMTVCMAMCMAM